MPLIVPNPGSDFIHNCVHKLFCANKPEKLFNTDRKLHKTKKVNYLFIVYLAELKADNRIDNFFIYLNKRMKLYL